MYLCLFFVGCISDTVLPELSVTADNFETHVDVETMSLFDFLVLSPKSVDHHSEAIHRYCEKPKKGIPVDVQVNYLVIEVLPDRLNVSGKTVLNLSNYIVDDDEFEGQVIPKFQAALEQLLDDSQLIGDIFGSDCSSADKVLVVAAQDLPYSTFRTIQYNVGYARIQQLYFLTEPLGENPSSVTEGKLGLSPLWVREELTLPIHSPS